MSQSKILFSSGILLFFFFFVKLELEEWKRLCFVTKVAKNSSLNNREYDQWLDTCCAGTEMPSNMLPEGALWDFSASA